MKYFLLLALIVGLVWWWLERRRAVVRERMEQARSRLPTELVACPKCGVYAPEGQHSCG